MNEHEQPLDAMTPGGESTEEAPSTAETPAEAVGETVEAVSEATAAAAAEVEAAMADLADVAAESKAMAAEARAKAQAATGGEPADQRTPAAEPRKSQPTVMDRLAEDAEYDTSASSDDKLLAALAYGSQLIIPVLVPAVLLISETSKKRPFQKYHAVQALALGIAVWAAESALGVIAGITAATLIGILCLCIIVPAMILVWLLPLYYAILAYSGQRFTIPGLTQFLRDQGWI